MFHPLYIGFLWIMYSTVTMYISTLWPEQTYYTTCDVVHLEETNDVHVKNHRSLKEKLKSFEAYLIPHSLMSNLTHLLYTL